MMRRLAVLSLLVVAACGDGVATIQGYVEGDYVRVGLPAGGRVVSVAVEKGQHVRQGELLFALDDQAERAAVAEARARLEEARFLREDLLTGKRLLELQAIEAQKAQAEAGLRLSAVQLRRQEQLLRAGNTAPANVDTARASLERDQAQVAELAAQLAFAREGGRTAAIAAAESAVEAAGGALAQAEWRLAQRKAEAFEGALVEDVLFRAGEYVGAGQPVVSLLPPGNVLFRFYLGPEQIGTVAPGAPLKVACEGCPPDLAATVTFVAREASYAPPVIYSRDQQAKLVFLVEAKPRVRSDRLRPGQPVTVILPGGGSGR